MPLPKSRKSKTSNRASVGIPKGGRVPLSKRSPEPTAAELEIYRGACLGKNNHQLALEFGHSWYGIEAVVRRCEEFLRKLWMDDIRRLKVRHAEALTHIWYESLLAWEGSKNPTVRTTTSGKGNSTTTTTTSGAPRLLAEARAAIADIGKIWGTDTPIKSKLEDIPRVAGKPQEQAEADLIGYVQSLIRSLKQMSHELS